MKSKFLYVILLLTVALASFHLAFISLSSYSWHGVYIILYVYFPLITLLIHSVLEKQIDRKPQSFVTYFMGSMSVKLFLSLILLLVVLYTTPVVRVPFALLFMAFYLAYTATSVSLLFKKLRQNN
jgi:hypothetical protein